MPKGKGKNGVLGDFLKLPNVFVFSQGAIGYWGAFFALWPGVAKKNNFPRKTMGGGNFDAASVFFEVAAVSMVIAANCWGSGGL